MNRTIHIRRILAGLAPAVALLPATAWSAAEKPGSVSPVAIGDLLRVSGTLVLVLGVIGLLAWAMRRMRFGGAASGRALSVVDRLSLGSREAVVLLQVGTEQVLVSQTPAGISRLHVLTTPVEAATVTGEAAFAERLKEILGKGRK